jgi:hypothetical protein
MKNNFQLEKDKGTIVGEANLKVFISEYYKKILGASEPNHFSLIGENIGDISQLSLEESNIRTASFTEDEVKEVIMQMERNKSLGPNGFPAEFYQKKIGRPSRQTYAYVCLVANGRATFI